MKLLLLYRIKSKTNHCIHENNLNFYTSCDNMIISYSHKISIGVVFMYKMDFRQIHLDFHTSEKIEGIGKNFDKLAFQDALKVGHIGSINLFAKCHHGLTFYEDAIYAKHPYLSCDLTREMVAACKEIGVKTQIYLSAGLDEFMAKQRPEWLFRYKDQSTTWSKDFFSPGYHMLCMNTEYLDYLLEQIAHVAQTFETDGIWLDIVGVRDCYCQTCLNELTAAGKDPSDFNNIRELGEKVYKNYLERVKKTVHAINPELEIFHNSGHVTKGRRDIAEFYSHIELESLPTGGWGYDHFPLSARYVQGLGKEFLGMTGKFHTTWGEFGGFKHPNALRYESALSLAHGAKVCVGDQMHPDGLLDPVTYSLIGEAFKEVEEKESWCDYVENVADIALFSQECMSKEKDDPDGYATDAGAIRMLSEGNYLFDVIDDFEDNLDKYKVIILPDVINLSPENEVKYKEYVKKGGKILATGNSAIGDCGEFLFDFGAKFKGQTTFRPDYFIPEFSYCNLGSTAFVMYSKGYMLELNGGEVLGERENSYFNRTFEHFSSHQHTPNEKGTRSPAITKGNDGVYISWEIFDDYAKKGSLILKEMFKNVMDLMLGENKTITTNLPAQGICTIQHQKNESRYINHLLYAVPTSRGENIQIIEDILPVYNTEVSIKMDKKAKSVYLAPQNKPIEFIQDGNKLSYKVDCFECHQMVVIDY